MQEAQSIYKHPLGHVKVGKAYINTNNKKVKEPEEQRVKTPSDYVTSYRAGINCKNIYNCLSEHKTDCNLCAI